jgi:hypothetical protein
MKYIFLVFQDEEQWNAQSTRERAAFEDACRASEQALWQSGHLLAVENLQSSRTAITVRIVDGRVFLTEGTLAKTKEQLIGIFFIKARDLNEAIQVASKIPQAWGGAIELRPMMEFNQD